MSTGVNDRSYAAAQACPAPLIRATTPADTERDGMSRHHAPPSGASFAACRDGILQQGRQYNDCATPRLPTRTAP
ncbi:MAG: hypothetical protein HFJ22_06200 [Clostridia bacterium]|nr:hypothetical protein [Clostridia bacterium]